MIILDNAVKFSSEYSVVSVFLKDRVVSINDHGTGIPEEDLPHIFERFYKSKSELNKNGTGLGLAIAKQIADRHNIHISVTSSTSEGTEFQLHF